MKYKGKNIKQTTQLLTSEMFSEGETIEKRLARIVQSEEPLTDATVPLLYQERKEGVNPMYDIRTDRMEMAQMARDKITRTHMLARANREDMGKKRQEEFTYVTDTNGNIVKNPTLENKQ